MGKDASKRISRRKFFSRATCAVSRSMTLHHALAVSATSHEPVPAAVGADSSSMTTVRVDSTAGHATNSFSPHRALGSSIDILPYGSVDKLYTEPVIKKCLSAGWGPMSYRQNTELQIAAWHWNPKGAWSDPAHKSGYFTGNSEPAEFLRHSYGYPLPHRGHTRNGGAERGYSRMTDGDPDTYWKSNPYLTSKFTDEDDSLHPQWVVVDLGAVEEVNAIRIDWPILMRGRTRSSTGPGKILWASPPLGPGTLSLTGWSRTPQRGAITLKLSPSPVAARFLRIWMTESSNTPDTHGPDDPRNSAGYAIHELYAGNLDSNGGFVDLVRHSPDQNQTVTYCSSIDPWHSESDLNVHAGTRRSSTCSSPAPSPTTCPP